MNFAAVVWRRGFLFWVTLAVCVMAGAALNVYRVSSWKTSGVHSPRGFQDPPDYVDGRRTHWARSFAKVEIFNQSWRPMRVTVTMRAAADAADARPEGVRVRVSADHRLMGTFDLRPAWSRHSFVITDAAPLDGRLWLQLEGEVVPDGPRGFGFASVETTPVFAARPIIVHGVFGAVLGAITWLVLTPRLLSPRLRSSSAASVNSSLTPRPVVLTALASALFVYLSGWALLRPPFQTPDEPQQHLRITSILLHPWFAEPNRFALDARYVSPLAIHQPRPIAGWIVALIVLNPIVAFMSSGVNPDAVSIPLSTLAILAVWRVLTRGIHRGRALVCLLAAALVKPSAGSLFVGLASGIAALWLARCWRPARALVDTEDPDPAARVPAVADHTAHTWHTWPAMLVVFQAAIVAAWGFYLWSPLLFADQQGSHDSLRAYLATRMHRIGSIAIEFWGRLGWLDYQIADGWYVLLYVLMAINAACVFWRPRRPPAFAAFAVFSGVVFVAFAAVTLAGEFGYLTQAGYTLQGRYFLPAVLGILAPILSHRVPPARCALLAGVIAVNLLLAQQTVTRYYEDGWSGVRQALPW